MHRTQLLLHDWQYQALKTAAEQKGCSLSALVREILEAHLHDRSSAARIALEAIEGVAEGPADLGREHDHYLYGASSRRPKKR